MTTYRLPVIAMLCLLPLAASAAPPGLWLLARKDAGNTARGDVPGEMRAAPRVVWSYGYDPEPFAWARRVEVGGKPAYLVQVRAGLRLVRPDGTVAWSQPVLGVSQVLEVLASRPGRPMAVVLLGPHRVGLVEVATGRLVWHWFAPPGSAIPDRCMKVARLADRALLVMFPNGPDQTDGYCFEIRPGRPVRLLWQASYQGKYWANFGPVVALADMDRDGRQEILLAGKPGYMGVVDLAWGRVKLDRQYAIPGDQEGIGRPYGLLAAVDLDGDGYRDAVMVSSAVEEYVGVLRNRGGKQFEPLWSQFVTWNYPDPKQELRPDLTSLSDVTGDGRPELVVGLYNETGDERWHTLVIDPLRGWRERLADLPGRYFWACRDTDGDGRAEIVTSTAAAREVSFPATVQMVDGRTGRDVAVVDGATFTLANRPMAAHLGHGANRESPARLAGRGGCGLLVTKGGRQHLWRLRGGKGELQAVQPTPLSLVAAWSSPEQAVIPLDLAIKGWPKAAKPSVSAPLVAAADGRRELVLAQSDNTIIGGQPDWGRGGSFSASWTVRGTLPAVWLGPSGERVVCAVDPPAAVNLYRPANGETLPAPVNRIRLPMPAYLGGFPRSTAGLIPYGRQEMRLFVGMTPGRHPWAGALFQADGTQLWLDPANGPYPRMAAVGELTGDERPEVVVDYMGREMFYDALGHGRLVGHGWNDTIPGRGDGAKYSLPIIGPFGPGGETRVLMSPGLDALELLGPAGERLAMQKYASTYMFQWCSAAVGHARDAQHWDVGMIDTEGVFHCADVGTCVTRWRLDLGAKGLLAANVAAGDLDGDGRDDFLVGLPDGRLVAVTERAGRGQVLWTYRFGAAVREAIMADADGDGRAEIVAELDNGFVKVLE